MSTIYHILWINSTDHHLPELQREIGFRTTSLRDEDLGDEWVKQSVKWIEQNRDAPFFLFFASHDIHVPRMPHERFQGQTPLGFRGDAIVELDWCVGQLLDCLDRLELTENTLVVFCSDKGPVLDDGYRDEAIEKIDGHQPAGSFSGGKYSVLEGGTRTPFITRWPGQIKPGVCDQVVCTIDLAASFAALTNVELPANACLDSFNVLDVLLGHPGAQGHDHLVQQDNGTGGNFGFRAGIWKLQRHDSRKRRNVNLRLKAHKAPRLALYDLAADPGEKQDLAAKHPDVVRRLADQLDDLIQAGRSRPQ